MGTWEIYDLESWEEIPFLRANKREDDGSYQGIELRLSVAFGSRMGLGYKEGPGAFYCPFCPSLLDPDISLAVCSRRSLWRFWARDDKIMRTSDGGCEVTNNRTPEPVKGREWKGLNFKRSPAILVIWTARLMASEPL